MHQRSPVSLPKTAIDLLPLQHSCLASKCQNPPIPYSQLQIVGAKCWPRSSPKGEDKSAKGKWTFFKLSWFILSSHVLKKWQNAAGMLTVTIIMLPLYIPIVTVSKAGTPKFQTCLSIPNGSSSAAGSFLLYSVSGAPVVKHPFNYGASENLFFAREYQFGVEFYLPINVHRGPRKRYSLMYQRRRETRRRLRRADQA
jgi:hypothetical protein